MVEQRDRQAVPAGARRPALGRDRRGVRQLDEPARQHLSPPARHPRRLGHRGQRAGHGVRQHGRRLRHRRVLHPRPVDRREHLLRRVPGQRAGRGRGRRHPHAAAAVERRAPSRARVSHGGGAAGRVCRTVPRARERSSGITTTCRTSSSPCSRTSCTCCRPATASARPPPACASRSRWRASRADRPARGDHARQPAGAGPVAAPDARPEGRRARCSAKGLPASPGAASGAVVFSADEAEMPRRKRRGGHPGAHRNQPGGYSRHARRARHPDHARRHDQPRGGGGARHGPALRGRRRRHPGRLRRADAVGRRPDGARRRDHHARRRDRRGVRRRGRDRSSRRCPAISPR